MKLKKLNNKGFSLIEVLVAIALLAVLMTVSVQAYNAYKKQARQQAYDTMAKSATVAATNYLMENTKSKYITFETLKDLEYVDSLQDPRYKEKECSGIVINKVMQGENQKQLDVLFQKVKLCCKNYKYQYDFTGDDVKITEIDSCEYVEGDEIDGIYKLIYKPQGGTECNPAIVMKQQREEWGPLCEITKENYVFKGWNTKKNGKGSTITEHTLVGDKDINAYAIWNAIHTLKYSEEGGTPCNPQEIAKENGEKWGNLCTTEKPGYKFNGWYTKKDGKGSQITQDTTANKNITVYAYWKPYYTLTFDSNEGTACNPSTITKAKDEKWGDLCTPTRTGYNFNGWYENNNEIKKSTNVEKDVVAVAKWSGKKYTLTYANNGGEGCTTKTGTYESTWGELCTPTKKGYTFTSWNTKLDGTGNTVTENTIVGSSNIKVYAQWSANACTLTYNDNEGSGCSTKTTTAIYGNTWENLCSSSKREHYQFVEWNTKANGKGTTVNNTTSTTTVCDSTVYAQWKKKEYTLSFSGTGSTNCSSIKKSYDTAWGTLCTPASQTHYSFDGWYYNNLQITENTKANETITVTSRWKPKKYTITYNSNGGTRCESQSVEYDTAWGTLCKTTQDGFTFTGWYDENNNQITSSTVCKGNKTVTANWTKNSVEKEVIKDGNSTSSSMTINISTTNPDKDEKLVYTATNGNVSCSYSGTTIVCQVTGMTKKTASSDADCQELAIANNKSPDNVIYIGTSKSYNSADYYDNPADGVGCYIKSGTGPGFTKSQKWSCYRAKTTFFTGSTDHCPKSSCGSSSCLTYGYTKSGSTYYCNCYLKLSSNIKTYYNTTITVKYYEKG